MGYYGCRYFSIEMMPNNIGGSDRSGLGPKLEAGFRHRKDGRLFQRFRFWDIVSLLNERKDVVVGRL